MRTPDWMMSSPVDAGSPRSARRRLQRPLTWGVRHHVTEGVADLPHLRSEQLTWLATISPGATPSDDADYPPTDVGARSSHKPIPYRGGGRQSG